MNLPEFLTCGQMGEIRLTGHRIDLYQILSMYKDGQGVEEIHVEYPTLPPSLIDKVLAFFLENEEEIDAYLTEVRLKIERQRAEYRPGPGIQRLRELEEARSPSLE